MTRRRIRTRVLIVEHLEDRTVPTAVAPPAGLVAWWTGDGDTVDIAGHHDGILQNGAGFDAGLVGQAFRLDGSSGYVRVPNDASLNLSSTLTIEAWVKPDTTVGNFGFVSKWNENTGDKSYLFGERDDGDVLHFTMAGGNGSSDSDIVGIIGIPAGTWTHVAVTYDATGPTATLQMYVNGVLSASNIPSYKHIPASAADLLIGAVEAGGGTNQYLPGEIDEVSVYNRALSATEIQSIYNAGADGKIRMFVRHTSPAHNGVVKTPPTSFAVDFSYAYDPATVQASDFRVNGIAANSVTLTDADTATFTFTTSPVTAEGVQTMHMDAGSVNRSGDGLGLGAYDDTFCYVPRAFFVVDATRSTFEYGITGCAAGNYSLDGGNSAPRGIATDKAGDKYWVVDGNKNVYVYDPNGALLGSWAVGGLQSKADLQGIATNGTDIWLLDANTRKVYKCTNAASRLSGSQNAASGFTLNGQNNNPQDMVTDGSSFWVLNWNSMVFKYSSAGKLLGSWTIDPANRTPYAITIDPNNPSDIWIVDSAPGACKVYQYTNAAGRTSGSQIAAASFGLESDDHGPQGIAGPVPFLASVPAASAAATASLIPNHSIASTSATASPAPQDIAWLLARNDDTTFTMHSIGAATSGPSRQAVEPALPLLSSAALPKPLDGPSRKPAVPATSDDLLDGVFATFADDLD
jgi:hypothetical protein